MTREETQQLKREAGLRPYEKRLTDLQPNGGEYRASCPWHERDGDHSPSLAVYKGDDGTWQFKCMSRECAQGDVIAFVQKLDSLTFADALRVIANDAGLTEASSSTTLEEATGEQAEAARQYLLDHGVSLAIAEARDMKAVLHPRLGLAIAMPYDADSEVIKYRVVGKPKDKNSKFSHASGHPSEDLLYNIKQTEKELSDATNFLSEVYVTESERDCLMLNSLGYAAVSVSSATTCVDRDGKLKIDEDHLKILARADHIYLALDQDPAGQKCADAFETDPAFNSVQVHRLIWDYNGKRSNDPKDIGDLYKQDPASFDEKLGSLTCEARRRPPKWRQQFCTVGELASGPIIELIRGFLPEGNIGIGGLSGAGKTFVALSIARALTTGTPFVGKYEVPKPVAVLYLVPEVGKRQFLKRVSAFGIPDDENLFLCRTLSEGPTLPLNHPFVLEAVRQLHGPVVILDTAIRFSDATDENSSAQNAWMERSIRSLREAGCVAVIALHHSPKRAEDMGAPTLENTFRGTGDIGALFDIAYSVRTDRELKDDGQGEQVTIRCVKARDLEDPPASFQLGLKYRGEGNKLRSFIDETGDLALMAPEDSPAPPSSNDRREEEKRIARTKDTAKEEAQFLRLVEQDPTVSLRTLQSEMKLGREKVKKVAGRLGYEVEDGRWTAPPALKSNSNDPVVLDAPEEHELAF